MPPAEANCGMARAKSARSKRGMEKVLMVPKLGLRDAADRAAS